MNNEEQLMGQTHLIIGDNKLDINFKGIIYMPAKISLKGGAAAHYLLFLGLTDTGDILVTGLKQHVHTLTACGEHTYRMDFAKVLKLDDVLKCTRTGFFFNRKNPGLSFLDNLGKLIDSVGITTGFQPILARHTANKLEHCVTFNNILKFFELSNFNQHPDIQNKIICAREELTALKNNAYGVYSSKNMNLES